MQARNRTWLLGSDPVERCRQRAMPIEGGDGSTLNLDFTSGVLDPRLTFTRDSPATFVNSSGYVQFANANCFTYSNPRPSGTAWGATGTVTWNGVGEIADPIGGTNAQSFKLDTTGAAIFNTAGTIVVSGITHTFSVWLRTVTGTTNARIGSSNTGAVSTITVTNTWQRFSCQYVTNGTNDGGAVFSQTGSPSATMYVWGAQIQPGSIVGDLIQTSGTQNYSTPRFDYSPTNIGAPSGLLVEGQTQNVLYYSQDVTQATRWTIQGGIPSSYTSVSATGGTAPDNTNTANLCTESTANNSRSIYQGLTAAAGTYTASVWVKAGTGSTRYIRIVIPSAAGNFVYVTVNISTGAVTQAAAAVGTASAASATVTPYPGSWYRIRLTGTLAAAVNFVFIVPLDSATPSVNTGDYGREAYLGNGSTFLIWGAQLESGSGASSYIPTGASQVTRNIDRCGVSGTNFSSWFVQGAGTLYAVSDVVKSNGRNLIARIENTAATTYIEMGLNAVGYTTEAVAYQGASFTSAFTTYTPTFNNAYKSAYTWEAGRLDLAVNGVSPAAAGATLATDLDRVGIGNSFSNTDVYARNGHIKQLKYYPFVMTDAQLNALTTP
jgi:hypothetical protein